MGRGHRASISLFERNSSQQNEPHQRCDEGQAQEDDDPTMGFRSSERFCCGTVIAAPPMAGTPEIAIRIILIHPATSFPYREDLPLSNLRRIKTMFGSRSLAPLAKSKSRMREYSLPCAANALRILREVRLPK
jgi:hypothetical protein